MNRLGILMALVGLLAAAASGCGQPKSAYEECHATLTRSRDVLIEGDRALSMGGAERAAGLYVQAGNDLKAALEKVEQAEADSQEKIRALDEEKTRTGSSPVVAQERTVTIGARSVPMDRYYAENLAAYRELWGAVVQMRSVALSRAAEAQYRIGAQAVLDGDQFYRARQFNTAEKRYGLAERSFRPALDLLGQTTEFLETKAATSSRLAASPPEVWESIEQVRQVAAERRNQADAYLRATLQRLSQTVRIVDAYRFRQPGNIPTIEIQPLAPLPEIVRTGVVQPPIPSTEPRAAPAPQPTP